MERICDTPTLLGEGPFWFPQEKRLYWLDIDGEKLHRFDPRKNRNETFELGTKVGCVVPVEPSESGNNRTVLIIASQKGVFEIEIPTAEQQGELENRVLKETFLAHPEQGIEGNRYNDGKCSPEGRFWFGSLNQEKRKNQAALYSMQPSGSEFLVQKKIFPATNSNGLSWSPRGDVFYWIDTPTRQVKAFHYDASSGEISRDRIVVKFPEDPDFGRPDGMCTDAQGHLWIAHWMGSSISCWDPGSGKMLQRIPVPAQRVTSLTFGSDSLDTLYITTADQGLFAHDPGVFGLSVDFFQHPG